MLHQHHDTMRNVRIMERHAARAIRPVIVLVDGLSEVIKAVQVVECGRFGDISLLPVDPELLGQLCHHIWVLAHRQDVLLRDWEDVLVDELLPCLVEGVVGQVAPDPFASVSGAVAVFSVCSSRNEWQVSDFVK